MAAVLPSRFELPRSDRRIRRIGVAAVLGMHALMLVWLLSYAPAREALLAAVPIMVELIQPPRIEPPKPEPPAQLPKPLPVVKRAPPPPAPLPVLTAPAEAPSPVVAPPPSPVPALTEPALVAVATPAPGPTTPPVFDADYLSNPAPVYPKLARRMGEQGRVILRVLVNPAGTAAEVQVRTSSGHARLDDAARETVRAWKFVPAKRDGQAVSAWVLIPISFRLEG